MFAALILVPALGYRFVHLDPIAAFWAAYILTRPLGASFADWMGVPANRGGLALGPGWVSLTLIVLIICLVAAQTTADSETRAMGVARP